MENSDLIKEAIIARNNSYSPYSNFMVGAALLSKAGKVYHGCNIENAAFTPTNCAERTAIFTAISQGEREFVAIAIAGWAKDALHRKQAFPCGVCRQVMMEFCNPKTFRIIVANDECEYSCHTLSEILPYGFGFDNLS